MTLRLEGISRSVAGVAHLRDVSLSLPRGMPNVLLGPTLSGKTSLMRLMAGLDRPDSGRILLDGKDVTGVPARRRSVAMVYQQFVNYPTLTLYENIASPLRVAGVKGAEIDRRVREAAALLRLEPLLERLPPQVSGGQQQRTAIARALVRRADLVLLDEPLANLDYKLREELREELPRLFADSGAILVYATTEPTEALLLGGQVVALWEGAVAQVGPSAEVYRAPRTLAAARVFSDPPMNELAIACRDGALLLPDGRRLSVGGRLASLPAGDHRLGFRAETLRFAAPAAGTLCFAGTVAVTEITGSESFVHVDVDVGAAAPARWVSLLPGVQELEPGQPVSLAVDPAAIFVFDAAGAIAGAPCRAAA
ncbi:ABC transporter ATP-binding protein [Roseomonas sp. NAR14]|uniref:ABC transporter ATP-binding protein n=1 Tax=Roseomonas acroporae TaxID=2937791 RepID=A0A9X2BZW8_9PROT|nr:ABC transporter ATP-binding protein [Roseomonas acroporae]MCK8787515.1 ABC transporter ATP-binding protein [Roseomonas acroporae]